MLKDRGFVLGRVDMLIDALLAAVSLHLAYYVRYIYYLRFHRFSLQTLIPFTTYAWLFLIILPLWPMLLEVNGLYSSLRMRSRRDVFFIVLRSVSLGTAILIVILFVLNIKAMSRILIIGFGGISLGLIFLKEIIVREILRTLRKKGRNIRKVLIVGSGEKARYIIDRINNNIQWGFKIIGAAVPDEMGEQKTFCGINVIGRLSDISHVLRENVIDNVIFAAGREFFGDVEKAVWACESQGVQTWLAADLFKTTIAKPRLDEFSGIPMLVFTTTPQKPWQLFAKQIIDTVGSFILLVILSPLFLIIGMIIKLTSPGPVFFKQKRMGLRGEAFTMYKFRSMVSSAEMLRAELAVYNEMGGPAFKITDDPRITKFGKFIRKVSIDELPQLWNVLTGRMSLVGPRPFPWKDTEKYEDWQRRRLSMKPGLTCLWQTKGRNIVGVDDWMRLDLEYIDKWSLWLDIKILFKTIPAVLTGLGAK